LKGGYGGWNKATGATSDSTSAKTIAFVRCTAHGNRKTNLHASFVGASGERSARIPLPEITMTEVICHIGSYDAVAAYALVWKLFALNAITIAALFGAGYALKALFTRR
jgi:hypothetical protein